MRKITVTKALSTAMAAERVARIADETGVNLAHLDTRLVSRGKWINDFEISGPPGKVDRFFERIDDIRTD